MNEKKLRKFKLIDREGFLRADVYNSEVVKKAFVGDTVGGYTCPHTGSLRNLDGNRTLINVSEFKFFEEVSGEVQEWVHHTHHHTHRNTQDGLAGMTTILAVAFLCVGF